MPAAPPAGSRCLRWIARHPVAALLLWFFTVGQAVAFVPAVASSYRALGPVHLFAFVPIGLVVAVATHGRLGPDRSDQTARPPAGLRGADHGA